MPMRHPISKQGWSLRSIKELEYSLTLRTLDTNAANLVAINRYQYVRLLPARVVSAYAAPTVFAIFSSCFYHHVFTARQLGSNFKKNNLYPPSSCSVFYTFFFRSQFRPRASNVQLLVLHGLYFYVSIVVICVCHMSSSKCSMRCLAEPHFPNFFRNQIAPPEQ